MKKHLISLAVIGLMAVGGASAHTIAIGSVNAGAPGSVTIWMGSYHGTLLQGSLTIGGSSYAFNQLTGALPSGLTFGTNTFYASGNGTLGEYNSSTSPTSLGINGWQGVTVTGLSAGTQLYTISGMTSANWADWNTGQSNWTGSIFIPDSSVAGIPEPASLALVAASLLGLGMTRRRRQA